MSPGAARLSTVLHHWERAMQWAMPSGSLGLAYTGGSSSKTQGHGVTRVHLAIRFVVCKPHAAQCVITSSS